MKILISLHLAVLLIIWTNSVRTSELINEPESKILLVASTPADDAVKAMLGIPIDSEVDFIRWEITFSQNQSPDRFILNLIYGKAQPNTLGFVAGGNKKTFTGTYLTKVKSDGNLQGEIYELSEDDASRQISLVKLSENLFHLVTPDNKLFVGNGGWSYTFNRNNNQSNIFPSEFLRLQSSIPRYSTNVITFDGRTPCYPFSIFKESQISGDCIKTKWSLILHTDPETSLPRGYELKTTFNRTSTIQGKWSVTMGFGANPQAVIFQLNPDDPQKSVYFLVGDENVLFFLDDEKQFLQGNSDFSFTLNKRE
jgi:hypothetical protein